MAAIKRMGNFKSMLGMLPGMQQMRAQLDAFDEKEFDRVEAMVRSMTPFERSHPKLINGSRRQRIARGSGMQVSDVNQLLERFTQAQKMMKSLARGGGPGLPGMPAMPGMRKGKGAPPPRKKAKSGNPAKRAAEERALADRATTSRQEAAGRAFGMPPGAGGAAGPADLDPSQLPPGFEKFLGR
jgi:signal recognition particle subunit SRP54